MARRSRVWSAIFASWLAFVAYSARAPRGAADAAPALPAHCEGAAAPDATLFLLGDAGAPREPREPLLDALAAEAGERVQTLGAERVAIAFLGDNVYPAGLRASDHAGRAEDERRLVAQLDAARSAGARVWVVPGNHDWDDAAPDGWDGVKRETRFVAARGASEVPPDGCPGPASAPLGDRLSLVFLDTQWWLQEGARPHDASSGCAAANEGEIERALAATLRDAGDRHAIVLAHHPLRSGGPHGGIFGWREHVFPLREMNRSLWIPVPVLGSVRHLARMGGASRQDLPSAAYTEMVASIERGFAAAPPLVFAAGHDHTLQVIRGGGGAQFHVVSGAGSAPELTWAYPIEGTLFATADVQGYARLDSFADGAVEVSLLGLTSDAPKPALLFSVCLAAPPTSP